MDIWLYVIISILFTICLLLLVKMYLIKKSLKEMEILLKEILKVDTNNLLTISSSDKIIRNLATTLNIELKKLRNQRLQYENGNQELKKIITNISHDLRTPLTIIKGYIDLLEKDKSSENQKRYLITINNKTNELTELTQQLFEYSKTIDMGAKIKKENCCINEMLEETLANYYHIFKTKHLVPTIEICEEKIYRYLDKNSITRVFENVLSNVSKYSNGDFKVILNQEGRIIFSNRATSLDVTTVQKIFDRYFTVENATKSSGLGLSIAKQLVELNGGSITAQYIGEQLSIEITL